MTVESMTVLDAIYRRRAIRNYKPDRVDEDVIHTLLDAAVHAPTALHEEPWSFVVVQDKALLDRLSEISKDRIRESKKGQDTPQAKHMLQYVNSPGFHLFYNAGTLVVICSKNQEATGVADCWLAAENLMLAACAKGLGSCVIGMAIPGLNASEVKVELGIPAGTTVIAPIILGVPAQDPAVVPRKPPDILAWK